MTRQILLRCPLTLLALAALLLTALMFTGCSPAMPPSPSRDYAGEEEAVVRRIDDEGTRAIQSNRNQAGYQTLAVELLTGPQSGQVVTADVQLAGNTTTRFSVGDRLLVQQAGSATAPSGRAWVVVDAVRLAPLQWLAVAFVLLVLWVGRRRGVTSLLGLVLSFLVVTQGVLPLLLAGVHPLVVSVAASVVILVLTLYLAHGVNRRTSVAVVATALTMVAGGVLTLAVVSWAKLAGVSEEALYLQSATGGDRLNLPALLQAGILIAILGVLDDVTIGQSAVVFALRSANPALSAPSLYQRGMEVGREHIASLVNTLVLVYAGASLPLLLFLTASDVPIAAALNREIVATEAVRTLVGSIALVAAVPLTTLLAAYVAVRTPAASAGGGHVHEVVGHSH